MIQRFITGFGLILIGGLTIQYGNTPLFLWVLGVSLLITYEIFTLTGNPSIGLTQGITYLLITALLYSTHSVSLTYIHSLISLVSLGYFISELFFKKNFYVNSLFFLSIRSLILSGVLMGYILLLRSHEHGLIYTWFGFICIWAGDIFALFGGKWLGKTPLSNISPNKTVEGTFMGCLGALICGGIYAYYFSLAIIPSLMIASIIPLIGQLGDLHESLFKRHFKKKDSSSLLPGHGGFYDRADSTLFVFPVLYYVLLILPL